MAPLVLAFTVSACGGGEAEAKPPRQWTREVCHAVDGWAVEIDVRKAKLLRDFREADSLTEARSIFVAYMADYTAATREMIGRVETAGTPAVEDGERVTDALLRALDRLDDANVSGTARARDLPVDEPRAFRRQYEDIDEEVEDAIRRLGDVFADFDEKYEADELARALEEEPACAPIAAVAEP